MPPVRTIERKLQRIQLPPCGIKEDKFWPAIRRQCTRFLAKKGKGTLRIILATSLALTLYPTVVQAALPSMLEVEEMVRRANDYYISNNLVGQADWGIGAYQTGNFDAYMTYGIIAYLDRALEFGTLNQWTVGTPWPIPSPFTISGEKTHPLHADSHTAAQVYLDLYQLDPTQAVRKAESTQYMDQLLDNTRWSDRWGADANADDDWGWIDAFYMAGPTLARMANIENDEAYRTQLRTMYDNMKITRGLFDDTEGLWYRDAGAKSEVSQSGGKVFWARGNGWVMAGLVRVLQQLPPGHADRAEFESMLQTMAAALIPLQGQDGFWRSSLLDPDHFPNPETSGTAFFTYALAWGINNGLLDGATYQPVVEAAWNGMVSTALQNSGLLGYIQNRGREPKAAGANESHPYGVGAFLLAGTEVVKLVGGPSPIWPEAGEDFLTTDSDANFEETVQLDGSASMVRSGTPSSVEWWIGDMFLAAGWQASVSLPHGTHTITLKVLHDDATSYEDDVTVTVANSSPIEHPVTSATATGDDGNGPEGSIDNDFGTRWSVAGVGESISFDLGSEQTVSQVDISWFNGDQRQAYFDLQVSIDGTSWENVLTSQVSSGSSLGLESFVFAEVNARYVRYIGNGNSSGGQNWNSLTEVDILQAPSTETDDGDALPDAWEIARLGTSAYDETNDPLGKGQPLATDFAAGTDPADPTAKLQLEVAASTTPGNISLSFLGRAAFGPGYDGFERRYTLWQSATLEPDSWQPVPGYESISPNNLTINADRVVGDESLFYRLTVDLQAQ